MTQAPGPASSPRTAGWQRRCRAPRVHSMCSAIISMICGNATSDLTLGSQGSGSSAWTSASPFSCRVARVLQPLRGLDDLLRVGRRHQHLRRAADPDKARSAPPSGRSAAGCNAPRRDWRLVERGRRLRAGGARRRLRQREAGAISRNGRVCAKIRSRNDIMGLRSPSCSLGVACGRHATQATRRAAALSRSAISLWPANAMARAANSA